MTFNEPQPPVEDIAPPERPPQPPAPQDVLIQIVIHPGGVIERVV